MELRVEQLKKKYKNQVVLSDISFTAYSGECIGFIGKNGCGKTTLLSILAGVLSKDSGKVLIDGKHVNVNSFSYDKVFGYLPQASPLPELLSVDDCLKLYCENRANYSYVIEKYHLSDMLKKSISKLSGGMKRRVAIACAMANRPRVLIMDEPTNHVDIDTRELLEDALLDYKGSVLFVSHDRFFINKLATRIVSIEDFKLISYVGNFDSYLNLI